jgi:2-methylcitrate dehydratase PrpD
MYVSERLAEWGSQVADTHTPAAYQAAGHAVMDVVGCMIAGAGDNGAASVRAALEHLGGAEGAAVVCGRLAKTSAPQAALANGMAAHSLDFDDTFLEAITHASAALVPALFALGDEIDTSGKAILDAYIVGLELHGALGLALNRTHYEAGWHATATLGVIGTAGACARLLKLDKERFAHALNLAVSYAAGTKVQFGSMAKPLHAGLAAKHAIEAARLAEAGVEGRVNAFEGPMGLLELYAGDKAPGWEAGLATLGAPLAIERQGLTVKRFPCCAATHRALDCVLDLMGEHGFGAADVAKVDVRVRQGHIQNLRYLKPESEFEARFSMQYCVAVALKAGTVGLGDFTPAAVKRPEIRALFPLVEMRRHGPEFDEGSEADPTPSIVTISLKDGRSFEARQAIPKGDAANPLNDAERLAKFEDCCRGFLAAGDIARLKDAIEGMAGLSRIGECTRLLRFEAGSDAGERFERRA